ncbi:hypothetical protein D3C80_2071730 [compost metagenome]
MDEPNCHTDKVINIISAALGLPNQLTGPRPKKPSMPLIIPVSLKILRNMMDTATLPPIIEGK